MINGTVAWAGSAALGVLAAALVGLTLHSAPVPHPAVEPFSEAWEAAEGALNRKSNRLPLRVRERVAPLPQSSSELLPPEPSLPPLPPRELTQVTPEIVASRKVPDLCERHGMRKVWVSRQRWRCR